MSSIKDSSLNPPVATMTNGHVRVTSYGNDLEYDPNHGSLAPAWKRIDVRARSLGQISNILWQRLANDHTPDGRFRVKPYRASEYNTEHFLHLKSQERTDGVMLFFPGDAVALASRDCPILTLYSVHGGPIAALHCSRSSLQGVDRGNPRQSVIASAFTTPAREFKDRKSLRGYLTMGIAPEHFNNEQHVLLLRRLTEVWGQTVVGTSPRGPTLNIAALVRVQLQQFGMEPSQLTHDGLDTYSDERLASVRARRGGHNLTIVTYLPRR